jgi:hypothetical protein
MSDDFQIAAERARKRIGERIWNQLSIHDRATAIYEELRDLDAERQNETPPSPKDDCREYFALAD